MGLKTKQPHIDIVETIPFPPAESRAERDHRPPDNDPGSDALDALDIVSRRMEVLARELNCLGYFDDDDGGDDGDRPRAA